MAPPPEEEEVKKAVNVEDEDMDISEPLPGGLLGLAMGSIYEEVGGGVSGVAEGRSNNKTGKMRMDDVDLSMQLQSGAASPFFSVRLQ